MPSRLYEEHQKIQNEQQQELNNRFQNFMKNPFESLVQRKFNIPKELANDPHDIIQHLVNTGQMNQKQLNSFTQFAQTAISQGFSGVQSGIDNLKYTIAAEECATRANDTQNTQNILNLVNSGIQSIKDQICQDKIDAKNDEIAQLRQEILFARGQASQVGQNATIIDGVYNRLSTCPVDTTPVYGRQPIFTCPQTVNGCGCGCGSF